MAAIAVILAAFVAWVFLRLGSVPFAVGFGGVAAISLLILVWALYRKRRGEQEQ
jgi:membrane protein implicated in regulation of membrane protease activity